MKIRRRLLNLDMCWPVGVWVPSCLEVAHQIPPCWTEDEANVVLMQKEQVGTMMLCVMGQHLPNSRALTSRALTLSLTLLGNLDGLLPWQPLLVY